MSMEQPSKPNPFPDPFSKPETPRTGKYCPRCRAMAPRDQAQCRQCGHQFRSGSMAAGSPVTQSGAADSLNRTMQFTLPPLSPQVSAPAAAGLFSVASRRRRPLPWLWGAVAGSLGVALVAAALLWNLHRKQAAADLSPAGVWATTLHSKSSANAHLEFAFQPGGGGQFSWRESGPAALSGQTPLRWTLNPDNTLSLALSPPAGGSAISVSLAGIFSSHAWTWRIDRSPRRLLLGSLVFMEKR